MGEAREKKEQEQLEKQLKQEQLRIEKEKKAQEKKLKEEQAKERKLQDKLKKQQEKEALEAEKRQQKERSNAKTKDLTSVQLESEIVPDSADQKELMPEEGSTHKCPENEILESESKMPTLEEKNKPTEATVIKRGVPKNTKPAPPVVAIKMVDLLGDGLDNGEEALQKDTDEPPLGQEDQ